jgi:DNA-binding NarL/FixJ family response regulator
MNISMPQQPYQIAIVDDHPLVRSGVIAVLSRQANLHICFEAASEEDALKNVEAQQPDLVIVDLSLRKSSGFTLFAKLLRLKRDLRILVLSMHDETIYAEKVLKGGAHGYVMKQEATEVLIEAINQLLAGELYVSNRMRSAFLKSMTHPVRASDSAPVSALTRAELVVLQHMGSGESNQQIAVKLNRSSKTIDVHRANIKKKMGFHTNAELLHFAIRWMSGSE